MLNHTLNIVFYPISWSFAACFLIKKISYIIDFK
ncbi:hypothetical protein HDEF_2285 [Candidatus Hamiltonella defensa 5AT (Acyrthosiphon pisum)]|uniref:Uncharacterized protein n=1 Tax=Hamiltonella defensa subsp. Acyrthosiphon pisum (strain 5AT) TaxID=572265 RepID=C4K8G8_HAMD5|nr:hypothetical protein HDEF_2285 [Candidatus Hamiltonella defensa 5AT (Acyrthosiphon pisum)]